MAAEITLLFKQCMTAMDGYTPTNFL